MNDHNARATFREPLWTEVTLRLRDGRRVRGVVQGAGGYIRDQFAATAAETVRNLVSRAEGGHRLPVYEPERGHVKVMLGMTAEGHTGTVVVPLRGATVES